MSGIVQVLAVGEIRLRRAQGAQLRAHVVNGPMNQHDLADPSDPMTQRDPVTQRHPVTHS